MKVQTLFATLAFGVASVIAGCNCKFQDPSGTGPQWQALTEAACNTRFGGETIACQADKNYKLNQADQCASGSCCIDSGAFGEYCKSHGAPGAYCW